MTLKEKKERAVLIRQIHATLLDNAYKRQLQQQLKAMADLAIQNQRLNGNEEACFIYEGKWYTAPIGLMMRTKTQGVVRTLDISLRPLADQIMHDIPVYQRAHLAGYLSNVLSTGRTVKCFKRLLPEGVWLGWNYDILNIGEPLTQEEIEKFELQNGNIKGREVLKQLFMEDLLMAKVI